MSNEKMVTEREAVERARKAAQAALSIAWPFIRDAHRNDWMGTDAIVDRVAPLPKVTRARVVCDPLGVGEWSARRAGSTFFAVHHREHASAEWRASQWTAMAIPERVAIWADLLANPTEEVDA